MLLDLPPRKGDSTPVHVYTVKHCTAVLTVQGLLVSWSTALNIKVFSCQSKLGSQIETFRVQIQSNWILIWTQLQNFEFVTPLKADFNNMGYL